MDDRTVSAVDKGIEGEEPYKSGCEKQAKDVTQETESAETPGAQPDKPEYVKGHPVIRNGQHSCLQLLRNPLTPAGAEVSRFIVSVRDDGDPALTFRSIVLGSAFTALSSVITMLYTFKPTQMKVFGGASSNEGLGLLNFGFDWQYIQSSYLSLPLKQQLNSWIVSMWSFIL